MEERTPTQETTRVTSPRCPECGSPIFSTTGWCAECGAELPGGKPIPGDSLPELVNPSKSVVYAGFTSRLIAFIIDLIFVTFAILLTFVVVGKVTAVIAGNPGFIGISIETSTAILIGIAIAWLYNTILESSEDMATLGKKIMGLKVVGRDGKAISFARANARFWSKCVSVLIVGYGFLMIPYSKRNQGLHDKWADTSVIRDSR